MKKIKFLLTIIFVVATATLLQAQEVDDIYFEAPAVNKKNINKYMGFSDMKADTASVRAYEMDYMRYCLGRYYKARRNAYWVSGASLAISFTAMQFDGDTRDNLLIVGGFTGLSSVVMFVAADRWLKRSSIKPSPNGLGVVIEF